MQYQIFYGPSRQAKAISSHDFLQFFDAQVHSLIVQAQNPDIGLSAAICTETTDIGFDITGLATYDRELVKVNVSAMVTNQALTRCIG